MFSEPSPTLTTVLQVTHSTTSSVRDIGELVAQDEGLSDVILRFANFRQVGIGREVDDVHRAALLLGANSIRYIAVVHELMLRASQIALKEKTAIGFWEDCLRRGAAAVILANRYGAVHPDTAFTIGFTLEFGRLILITEASLGALPYSEVRRLCGEERLQAEVSYYGGTHHETLLAHTESWQLPTALTDAVARHQDEAEVIRQKSFSPLATFIARWANAAAEVFTSANPRETFSGLVALLGEEAGLNETEVEQLIDQLALQTMTYASLLDLELPSQPNLQKLLQQNDEEKDFSDMDRDTLLEHVEVMQVHIHELEEELQELRAQLLSLSQFDPMTGLPSRGHFMVNLRQEVARARRYDRPLSLVVVDIDEFTEFNARNGQTAGDHALQDSAKVLRRVVRDSDFLARSGGDEFVVILPETDAAGGRVFAERLRACLESLKLDVLGKRLPISACVTGVHLAALAETADHEIFYAMALKGVKKLRTRGPNRVSWVDPRDNEA